MSAERSGWQPYITSNGARQRGVEVRHRADCKTRAPGCKCRPRYRISVPLGRSGERTYASGASLAEARADVGPARPRAEEKHRRGRVGRLTVSEAAAQYVRDLRAGVILTHGKASSGKSFKPRSVDDRADCLRILCNGLPELTRDGNGLPPVPGLGHMRVGDVRHSHLNDLLEQVRVHQSASRCNRIRDAARCLFRRLEQIDHEFHALIRWELVERRRVERRELGELDGTRLLALLDVLQPRERAAYSLAAYLGLRIAEILALRVEDVDLKAGVIHVVWAWDEKHRQLVPTKSDAGARDVPLIKRVGAALRPLCKDREPEAYLFANPRTGLPVKGDTIRSAARRQWAAAGTALEMLPHEARHLAISIWTAAGVDDRTRIDMAGHASKRMNLAYAHRLTEQQRRARDSVEAFINGSLTGPEAGAGPKASTVRTRKGNAFVTSSTPVRGQSRQARGPRAGSDDRTQSETTA
jgi:integrase